MLFSIIVPVYNVEKYIKECIEAILTQISVIGNSVELILVDDGSTDNSPQICDAYRKKYPDVIKTVHKSNEGLLLARRTGYRMASGDYIINCDSDDMLVQNCLIELSKLIKAYEPDVIFFNADILENGERKGHWSENIFSISEISKISKKEVWENFFETYYSVSMCCKIYRRKCIDPLENYQSFSGLSMGEDTLQSLEIYKNADSFLYYNKSLYLYRTFSGMTAKFFKGYYGEFKKVCEKILEYRTNIDIDNFDEEFSVKLFSVVGRSITQGIKAKQWNCKNEIKYMKTIVSDDLVQNYKSEYSRVKNKLQFSHRIICGCLLKRRYFLLFCILSVRRIAWS